MKEKIIKLLEMAKKKDKEVCIFGAGEIGTGYGLKLLSELGIAVDFYCDNNPRKWGKEIISGVKCVCIDELIARNPICFVFVGVIYLQDICIQVANLGIKNIVLYDELLELKIDKYFSFKTRKQTAIYTCIVNDYDTLKEPEEILPGCDYFVISDRKPTPGSAFQYIDIKEVLPRGIEDNTRKNRYCKINAHEIFSQYKYSVYFDGSIRLKNNIIEQLEYLPKTRTIALSRHFFDCIYMEAMRAIEHHRYSKESIMQQAERYWLEGMPEHFGAVLCGILIREHNNPICKQIMLDWWEQVSRYSRRDQMAFPYVIWKNGFQMSDVGVLSEQVAYDEGKYWNTEKEHAKPRV